MTYVRLEETFRESPKVKRLARALSVGRAQARGLLAGLWSWCITHAPDGDLSDFGDDEIEEAADWEGEAGKLIAALRETHFVDPIVGADRSTACAVHDWTERAEGFKKAKWKREDRAKKKAEARRLREESSIDAEATGDDAGPTVEPASSDSRADVAEDHDLDLDHEMSGAEQSGAEREPEGEPNALNPLSLDGRATVERQASTAPLVLESAPRSTAIDLEPADLVVAFPVKSGKTGKQDTKWFFTERHLTQLATAFPAVDVRTQAQSALLWVEGNPTKRKTARGMPEFLRRWMEREQNRGGVRGNGALGAPASKEQLRSQRSDEVLGDFVKRHQNA